MSFFRRRFNHLPKFIRQFLHHGLRRFLTPLHPALRLKGAVQAAASVFQSLTQLSEAAVVRIPIGHRKALLQPEVCLLHISPFPALRLSALFYDKGEGFFLGQALFDLRPVFSAAARPEGKPSLRVQKGVDEGVGSAQIIIIPFSDCGPVLSPFPQMHACLKKFKLIVLCGRFFRDLRKDEDELGKSDSRWDDTAPPYRRL